MRELAGMSPQAMAAALGTDPPKISQMENGKSGISVERLRSFAAASKCANEELLDALAVMAQDRGKQWWDSYRGHLPTGFLDIAEMEHHADDLVAWATTFIPGLVQSSSYASAIFTRTAPRLPRHELDARTAFRVQRQRILADGRKPYTAFIHEAALRMQFGGPAVLRDQLDSLIADSKRPGITIRTVPFDVDTFPGAGENLYYVRGAIAGLDTVQLDVTRGPIFVHSEAELASYRATFSEMDKVALSPKASRDFILQIKQGLKGK